MASGQASGPFFYTTVTPTLVGEVVVIQDPHGDTKHIVVWIGSSEDDFTATGWNYDRGAYNLIIPFSADIVDTTKAIGLSGMIVPIDGLINAIIVKPISTVGAKITIQAYEVR